MMSLLLEPCVCSSCFIRDYKFFETPNMVGRKKLSAARTTHFSHPTPEEIQRKQLLWKRYLRRSKRKQTPKKSLVRRKRSPCLTDGGIEFVNEMRCSEVFWESPKEVDGRVPIKNLTAENFWDFVYQNTWKGRIRVCEGELMYKVTETLNTLVKEKVIGSFNARRLFSSEDIDNTARMDYIQGNKSLDTRFAVQVEQTYYGGFPKRIQKRVQFAMIPPRNLAPTTLKTLSPILKRANTEQDKSNEKKLPASSPSAKATSKSSISHPRRNALARFIKQDFASLCLKATDDFVVVREVITNSSTLHSSTSLTLRTKENLAGTKEIALIMNKFYTSKTLPEHSYILPEVKIGTNFLEMVL